ncbi:MAG TPA: YciI family protein [Acidimicrobiales bacterium]|nr:YciI family protein [Acidimicrobiales bacterium]
MAEFLLMFVVGPCPPPELSPDEMQALVARYVAWGERMAATGHGSAHRGARLSDAFSDPGRVLAGDSGEVVATDGPLAETKEVVGGYGVITAADYDEAVELCRNHPAVSDIGRIVIRRLA